MTIIGLVLCCLRDREAIKQLVTKENAEIMKTNTMFLCWEPEQGGNGPSVQSDATTATSNTVQTAPDTLKLTTTIVTEVTGAPAVISLLAGVLDAKQASPSPSPAPSARSRRS